MNTIIIEHADNTVTNAIKELMGALGLPVKIAPEEEWTPVEGIITNPEIIRRIKDHENGRTKEKGRLFNNTDELKVAMDKIMEANA